MMQDQSQSLSSNLRSAVFDASHVKMTIKTLTHDYYMLQLPKQKDHQFYRAFPHYLKQYNYHGTLISSAPVARIYGTNQHGQKSCCHIHGYFPYFYIKCQEYSHGFANDKQFLNNFLTILEKLYQRAYKNNLPIILNAITQQKLDFYGYHEKIQTFLKIYVYDPAYIIKLRELLDSKILGKSFQCYEAHLSYFMQLFSDHNIYGINELGLVNFTFRKNMSDQVMELFTKINSKNGKIVEGFDIVQLKSKYPLLFNGMYKVSTCYIELDVYIHNIVNSFAPRNQLLQSDDQDSLDSELESDQSSCKRKFTVKITRALEEIWKDEKHRRKKMGIIEELQGIIDYSKNIQAKILRDKEQKDPLWISFIRKKDNMQKFKQFYYSFQIGQPKKQSNQINIQSGISQNYNLIIQQQRVKLLEKVKDRWKYYESRKINFIDQILRGQRQQLPQWADDQIENENENEQEQRQLSDEENENVEKEELELKLQTKSQAIKTKNLTNVALYRNNYKHQKASLIKDSFFYICQFCKKIVRQCVCKQSQCSSQLTAESSNLLHFEQISLPYHNYEELSKNTKWKFNQASPNIDQVLHDIQRAIQKPYYSNLRDLFNYHKINQFYEPCIKHAQILQRELKILKQFNRQPITIKNEIKLPSYFLIDPIVDYDQNSDEEGGQVQGTYLVKYEVPPPSLEEAIDDCKKQSQVRFNARRSTSIKMSKQDTFVSDLIIFHYEFLVGFEKGCRRYTADPEKDQIIAFFFHTRNFQEYRKAYKGVILVQKYISKQSLQVWEYEDIYFVQSQKDLLSMVISIIFRIDPDIFVTFDQQKRGIRYLTQRGFAYGINFQGLISRACEIQEIFQFINFRNFKCIKEMFLTKQILLKGNLIEHSLKTKNTKSQELIFLEQRLKKSLKRKPVLRQKYRFDIDVRGRVNMSIYRICQAQLKLKSYTIQNICKQLFGEQIAQFTDMDLYRFYIGEVENEMLASKIKNSKTKKEQGINFVLQYINKRLDVQAEIVVNLNMISVLVQKSKIYGCDIVSMMERGSQFKIQAIMCRVTKKLGYLTLSASKRQVGNQSVLQCVPLVIQPPKEFFSEPVLLFDFQSLYPSVMIAYNICYSTCLGGLNNLFDKDRLKRIGVSQKMDIDLSFLDNIFSKYSGIDLQQKINNYIFLTPNKIAFVKKTVRQGVLPRILLQFLISRIMIKKSEGLYTKTKIKKVLKDRQYALKLFMNVMFGYSGASFSGRMPCSQVADSIVQISKYLLRQSIDYLNTHSKIKGKVIYGDTDSIFFHIPGYTIPQAIKIGKDLALQITSLFPYPIQMKFEKVYDGLFLVAKKRYYGKMYESETSIPKHEGKGLECVRRDGISLTENLMKKLLNCLIDSRDLSKLKEMFIEECSQVLSNQKNQSEFCLAKEVKLLKYSQKTCPAHGEAAKRLQKIDPMMVPKYGERMKYFVINGGLTAIKNRSISVFEYLQNKNMSLDLEYYFRKQIVPPLQRVLSSLADLNEWIAATQYRNKVQFKQNHQLQTQKKCIRCGSQSYFVICERCLPYIDEQAKKIEIMGRESKKICKDCLGCSHIAQANKCVQWNCEQLWKRRAIEKSARNTLPELIKLRQALLQLKY